MDEIIFNSNFRDGF